MYFTPCMPDPVHRILQHPIPSPYTIIRYLKLFPPSNPVYIHLARSISNSFTDADLFKLIWVRPNEIQFCSPRFGAKWDLVGQVVDGQWDQNVERYEDASFIRGVDASFHRSLEMHFVEDVQWEDTPFIQQVLENVNRGTATWTCSNRRDVEEKCARVDRLYKRIEKHGYLTQDQRRQAGIHDLKQSRQSKIYRWLKEYTVVGKDEVTVNIGRNGTLLRFSGKHRLSIAKILELDTIPVLVLARHRGWQQIRDTVKNSDVPVFPEFREHPDLQDLIGSD